MRIKNHPPGRRICKNWVREECPLKKARIQPTVCDIGLIISEKYFSRRRPVPRLLWPSVFRSACVAFCVFPECLYIYVCLCVQLGAKKGWKRKEGLPTKFGCVWQCVLFVRFVCWVNEVYATGQKKGAKVYIAHSWMCGCVCAHMCSKSDECEMHPQRVR